MTVPQPSRRYRFGIFEADTATGELRRQGVRVRLHSQPFQILVMLLERPGELLTREEISRALWAEGTFVDYDHGVNSAVNRLRDALSDRASQPRMIETLARRGYRFLAPVEQIGLPPSAKIEAATESPELLPAPPTPAGFLDSFLAAPEDLPKTSHGVARTLFLLLQVMYLAFYVGALANLAEISELLSSLPHAVQVFALLVATAAALIPFRAFLFCAVLFRAPNLREKFAKLWPFLLAVDVLWSLSPFLLLHHINYGVAIACTALLVYSPFAQRSLVLMGAGDPASASEKSPQQP